MKTEFEKIYAPVTPFERQTSHCPLYVSWVVLDEARDYFRTPIPEAFADKLAHRAEAVFAGNPFWQRKYKSGHGRDYLLMTMRHWLAGVFAKEQPALFRDLPDSFKVGEPLPPQPPQPLSRPKRIRKRNPAAQPYKHFVHGCELLAV
jgi:hypothetical protein